MTFAFPRRQVSVDQRLHLSVFACYGEVVFGRHAEFRDRIVQDAEGGSLEDPDP
jgi:hypothetical protein